MPTSQPHTERLVLLREIVWHCLGPALLPCRSLHGPTRNSPNVDRHSLCWSSSRNWNSLVLEHHWNLILRRQINWDDILQDHDCCNKMTNFPCLFQGHLLIVSLDLLLLCTKEWPLPSLDSQSSSGQGYYEQVPCLVSFQWLFWGNRCSQSDDLHVATWLPNCTEFYNALPSPIHCSFKNYSKRFGNQSELVEISINWR